MAASQTMEADSVDALSVGKAMTLDSFFQLHVQPLHHKPGEPLQADPAREAHYLTRVLSIMNIWLQLEFPYLYIQSAASSSLVPSLGGILRS